MSPFREIRSGSRSLLLNYAQTSFFYAKTFEREIIQRRQGEKRLQMRPLVMIDLGKDCSEKNCVFSLTTATHPSPSKLSLNTMRVYSHS